MALSASSLYRLSADQLHLECSVRRLSCCGPMRELRRRLAFFLRRGVMERFELQHDTQASVPAGVLNTGFDPPLPLMMKVPSALVGLVRPLFLLTW